MARGRTASPQWAPRLAVGGRRRQSLVAGILQVHGLRLVDGRGGRGYRAAPARDRPPRWHQLFHLSACHLSRRPGSAWRRAA